MSEEGEEYEAVDVKSLYDPLPGRIAGGLLVSYFTLGIVFYSLVPDAIGDEDRSATDKFVDALYFVCISLSTVGFGDLEPRTASSRLFTSFFLLFGVSILGGCLGVVLNMMEDRQNRKEAAARRASEVKMWRHDESMAEEEDPGVNCCLRYWRSIPQMARAGLRATAGILIAVAVGVGLIMIDGGTTGQMDFGEAWYFAVVSVTTVGYGDQTVHSIAGKVVAALYAIVGTLAFASAIGEIASIPIKRRQRRKEAAVMTQYGNSLQMEELRELIRGSHNGVSIGRDEFILRMLVRLDRVDVDLVKEIGASFDVLDKSNDGLLSQDDVTRKRASSYGELKEFFQPPPRRPSAAPQTAGSRRPTAHLAVPAVNAGTPTVM